METAYTKLPLPKNSGGQIPKGVWIGLGIAAGFILVGGIWYYYDQNKKNLNKVNLYEDFLKNGTTCGVKFPKGIPSDIVAKIKCTTSYQEAINRIVHLKKVIEHEDGFRFFHSKDELIREEKDLHILFKLTWFETIFDVNSEVNNGLGPVDSKISFGRHDQTIVEFKMASNTSLSNFPIQLKVYEKANYKPKSIVVIFCTSKEEKEKVDRLVKMTGSQNVILIDARKDNKISASRAKVG